MTAVVLQFPRRGPLRSIEILRETCATAQRPAMLYSETAVLETAVCANHCIRG